MTGELSSTAIETPAESEPVHDFRRLISAGTLALACGGFLGGLAGAAEGALTPTDVELGPHNATAQLTLDPHISFDLGPLGSADKPTGWEMGGVKVTVKGIPDPTDRSPLTSTSAVIAQYEQLLADPNHIKEAATNTVLSRIWHDSVEGGAFGAAGLGAIVGFTEPNRRRKQQAQATALQTIDSLNAGETEKALLRTTISAPPRQWARLCAGVILTSALAATACGDSTTAHDNANHAVEVDHILDGTPLEGFAIHGELLQLAIDQGGGHLKSYIDLDNKYYNQVAANFQAAFAQKFKDSQLAHNDFTYILSISDNHCNIGMDRVHGAIANAFKVDGVIDSGDMTMSGTAAEAECVSAEADALTAKGRGLYFAAGNHDSPTIEELAGKKGFTVLSLNKPAHLGNLSILGGPDVNESTLGTPMHLRGSETVDDETIAVTAAAAKQRPNILVMHEPEMAIPAVTAGSAGIAITGHLHQFVAPKELNSNTESYIFTEGTSGGAKENTLTLGPLQATSDEAVFVFDKTTEQPVGYYRIQAHPDGTVTISDYQPMGLIIPHKVTAD